MKILIFEELKTSFLNVKLKFLVQIKHSWFDRLVKKELLSYWSLKEHRRKLHGAKQRYKRDTIGDLDKAVEREDRDKLKEELRDFQQFLVDTETEKQRYQKTNFQVMYQIYQREALKVFNQIKSADEAKAAIDLFTAKQ